MAKPPLKRSISALATIARPLERSSKNAKPSLKGVSRARTRTGSSNQLRSRSGLPLIRGVLNWQPRKAPAPLWAATLVAGLALAGAACTAAAVEAPAGDAELQLGQSVYTRNCASCHGATGAGGRGLKLNEGEVLDKFPAVDDQISVIADGRGTMPAFGGRLSEEDIAAVTRYTREVLNP